MTVLIVVVWRISWNAWALSWSSWEGPKWNATAPVDLRCFCASGSRTVILYQLHLGLLEREGLAGKVQEVTLVPLHLNIIPPPELQLVTLRGGKQNSPSTARAVSPAWAWRLPQARHRARLLLTRGFSRLFLLSAGSTQPGPTLSFSPRREATADFQQTDLQTNRSFLLSQFRCQGGPRRKQNLLVG